MRRAYKKPTLIAGPKLQNVAAQIAPFVSPFFFEPVLDEPPAEEEPPA